MGQDLAPERTAVIEGKQLGLDETPIVIGVDGLPLQIPIGLLTDLEVKGCLLDSAREKGPHSEKEILGEAFLTTCHDFHDFTEALLYLPKKQEYPETKIKETLAGFFPTWSKEKLAEMINTLDGIILEEPLNEIDYQRLAQKIVANQLNKLEDKPELAAQFPDLKEAWKKSGLDQRMTEFAQACWQAHQGIEINPWERKNRFFGLQVLIEVNLDENSKLVFPLRIHSLLFRKQEMAIGHFSQTVQRTSTSLLLIPESAELGAFRPLINSQLLPALVVLAAYKLTPDSIHSGGLPLLRVMPADFNLSLSTTPSGQEKNRQDYCLTQRYSPNKGKFESASEIVIPGSQPSNLTQELKAELAEIHSRLNSHP